MTGLALIGVRWTREGVWKSHPSFAESNTQLMYERMGNLNSLQFLALLMVVGELKFVYLGPVELFGHSLAQLKIYEAFFLNLSHRSPHPSCLHYGWPRRPSHRGLQIRKRMEMMGAQERGELGLLTYLNALMDEGMLTSNPKRIKREDTPHGFPVGAPSGSGLGMRLCVPWADHTVLNDSMI